jgi:calcineurin-like phosphoesterase family protein
LSVKNNAFSRYGSASLVVWPIIGKPAMLTISEEELKKKKLVEFELWILCVEGTTIKSLKEELKNQLTVKPLLGLDSKTRKAIQGKEIIVSNNDISSEDLMDIDQTHNLDKFLMYSNKDLLRGLGSEPPHKILDRLKVFPNRTKCFRSISTFDITDEIRNYLSTNKILLFDITQTFKEDSNLIRELNHAISLFKRDSWNDLNFIHVSDLHLSQRNDDFLGVITKNLRTSVVKSAVKVVNSIKSTVKPAVKSITKTFKFIGKKIWDFASGEDSAEKKSNIKDNNLNTDEDGQIVEEEVDQLFENVDDEKDLKDETPLEDRIINPNNEMRRFICLANQLAMQGELDFIVMTGDLVDFCIKADNITSMIDYNYESSNWVRFLDILLNRPLKPKDGFELLGIEELREELLVPIFTVPGNHDYRVGHYSILSLGIYKHLGLKWHEAFNYDERATIAPLMTSKKSLLAYYQYINPFDNYFLKLGKNTFIFLDSGGDALLEFKSLLMAEPALTGFSNLQVDYLKLLEEHIIEPFPKGQTFFFSHAPIINPIIKKSIRKKIQKLMKLTDMQELEAYQESNLKKSGEKDTRSDIHLEYRSGTISQNWVETIGIIQRNKGFALNGHTHKLREFRTERSEFPSMSYTGYGKKVMNPFAIYWDNYTEEHGSQDVKYFEDHLPFHFQTPALGIADAHYGIPAGSYRMIQIQENRIKKIAIDYLGKEVEN